MSGSSRGHARRTIFLIAVLFVTVVARGAAAQGAQTTLPANGRIAFADVTGIA